MEIKQFWKKNPETTVTTNKIPDKFGHWFAKNLPDFFTVGVTQKRISNTMPPKLFVEWCRINNIRYWDKSDLENHEESSIRKEVEDDKF